MKTIDDLLKAAGGRSAVARTLGLHPTTPGKWVHSGIPMRYWGRLCRMVPGITQDDIFAAHLELQK